MRKHLFWFIGLMIIVLLNAPAICNSETRIRTYHSGPGTYQKKPVLRPINQGKPVKNYNRLENMGGNSGRGNPTKLYGPNRQKGWKIN